MVEGREGKIYNYQVNCTKTFRVWLSSKELKRYERELGYGEEDAVACQVLSSLRNGFETIGRDDLVVTKIATRRDDA